MDNAYNLLIKTNILGSYNVFGLTEEQVKKAADAYLKGESSFTIKGQKCPISGVSIFKIYDHTEIVLSREESITYYMGNVNFRRLNIFKKPYLPEETLTKMGKDVTYDFIGDNEYGAKVDRTAFAVEERPTNSSFINKERIVELEKINPPDFDLSRLIGLCKELNDNFSRKNYISSAILSRAIIDHIPPIFGFKKFDEVASKYGGQSFKKNMSHLNVSMRSISDRNLHETISKKEVLPNETQIDFSQNLDVLLAEIVKKLG